MKFSKYYYGGHLLTEAVRKEIKVVDEKISKLDASHATEIYETMAVMVAMVRGKLELGKIEKFLADKQTPEFARDFIKKELINKFAKKSKENEKIFLNYVDFIGGKMMRVLKQTKAGWPSAFILKDIGTPKIRKAGSIPSADNYYDSIDTTLIDLGSKQNTADAVLVFGTSDVKKVLQNMKNINSGNIQKHISDNGVITVLNDKGKPTSMKILQISLKKSATGARIGKISTFAANYLGSRTITPKEQEKKMVAAGLLYKDLPQIDESILTFVKDKLSIAFETVKGLASKLGGWVSSLVGSVKGGISNTLKKLKGDKYVKSSEKLAAALPKDVLSEDVMSEGAIPLTKAVIDQIDAFFRVNKGAKHLKIAFDIVDKKIKEVNKLFLKEKQKNGVIYINNDAMDPSRLSKQLNVKMKEWKTFKKKNTPLTREWIGPLLKLNTNYVSYKLLADLFDQIKKENKTLGNIKEASVAFVVRAEADAIFGNTQLPLWKVFGGDHEPEFLSIKSDYSEAKMQDIIEKVKNLPFIKVIVRAPKDAIHNNIIMFLLSGTNEEGDVKYIMGEIGTASGSKFSFKFELNQIVTKDKMFRTV